jgi:putative membrane protein
MIEPSTVARENRFEVRVTADSHFAWLRTRLSLERTLMSWLRTAVSLIGFGFAIVQFFDRLGTMPGARSAMLPGAPAYLGLGLITCGVLALVIALWQYWTLIQYLRTGSFAAIAGVEGMRMPVAAMATAILLILVGLFALFAVLFRLG